MEDADIKKLVELVKSPVKNISYSNNSTIIEFENGQTIPLYGQGIELNLKIPLCNFCGDPGTDNEPLFTNDNENFICVNCTKLALETFIQNGVSIDLKIGSGFEESIGQLNKMINKINDKKIEPES